MNFKLPRLYPILDRTALTCRGEDVATVARELAQAGVELLQYRNKLGSPQEILADAATLSAAFRGSTCLLVMNDRADLAVLAGWRAVHVGQGDLPPSAARRVLGQGTSMDRILGQFVGVSTHNEKQVCEADEGTADYIAVGPVFATGSKQDTEPVVGLEGVRRARALTRKPLVAIGGITRENASSVIHAGADSIAVIGALFAQGERPGVIAQSLLRLLA